MAGRTGRGAHARVRPGHAGQATVEFALILPLVCALLMLVIQVALVARDEIRVVHAARAAAREASVSREDARVRAAATRSIPDATVEVTRRNGSVEVVVAYVSATELPLIGVLLPDVTLRERAVMTVEQ
jgi:Flp pilus assembly protein TadG